MASIEIERPDNKDDDALVIELPRERTVKVPREEITNPTLRAMRCFQKLAVAADKNDQLAASEGVLEMPEALGMDTDGWRADDLMAFSSAVMGAFAESQELSSGESAGSGE